MLQDLLVYRSNGKIMYIGHVTEKNGCFFIHNRATNNYIDGFFDPYTSAIQNLDLNMKLIRNVEVPEGVVAHEWLYDEADEVFYFYPAIGGKVARNMLAVTDQKLAASPNGNPFIKGSKEAIKNAPIIDPYTDNVEQNTVIAGESPSPSPILGPNEVTKPYDAKTAITPSIANGTASPEANGVSQTPSAGNAKVVTASNKANTTAPAAKASTTPASTTK